MKAVIIKIFIFALNVIYAFYKLLPQKDKVVMISRQSNAVNDDFRLLGDVLSKKHQVVYLCKTLDGGVDSGLKTKISYGLHMFTQMYHLSTSKVCVLDSYSPIVSLLNHKKTLTVVQIWHSIGTLKKFGWQILGWGEGSSPETAKLMRMHKNYDVIYCAGKEYLDVLAEGFNVSEDVFKIYTLPRIDLLKNKEYQDKTKQKIYQKYPMLADKPNVVYAPTFRKNESEFNKYFNALVDAFDFEKYNLIVKLHPLSEVDVCNDKVIFDKEFSSFEMFSVADKLISDYSCIVYEAGIKGIPLYFYNYDAELYEDVRGLTIDYNDLPGYKEKDAKKLVEKLELEYDYEYMEKYIRKYIENVDNCAEKMAADIESYM